MPEPSDVTHFDSPAAFRAWLAEHHAARDELWVGYWKKATGRASLTWEESVDEALCFGWIDGIRQRLDEEAYTIRFTPRRAGSVWSSRNMARYAEMDAQGRVHVTGRAAYDRRVEEKTGIYSFEQKEPPKLAEEYVAQLRANEAAWVDWKRRPPGYKKRVTHWIMSAKRAETRQRRLERLIEDPELG